MAKFVECTVLVTGESAKISINFDNVETLEATEQHGQRLRPTPFNRCGEVLICSAFNGPAMARDR